MHQRPLSATNRASLPSANRMAGRRTRVWLSRRIRSTTVSAWLLILAVGCGTNRPVALSPEQVASLTERFQAELDRLHQEAQATEEVFPGATAAFILPDGQMVGVATGYSDIEADVPMTPDLRMPSGSIGKTYVAAVALSMALDGTIGRGDGLLLFAGIIAYTVFAVVQGRRESNAVAQEYADDDW